MSSPSPRQPFLVLLYEQYLENQDSAGFISKVAQTYTQGTLERLTECPHPQIRRAAVWPSASSPTTRPIRSWAVLC